jgi:small subunit ribosomal protein S8
MIRDWLAAMLNDITNCRKAGKTKTATTSFSNLMVETLKLMKEHNYIADFNIEEDKFKKLNIVIGKLHECKAIKPRVFVNMKNIDGYVRRHLPSRDVGILIISTDKGLISHRDAIEKKIGGCLIAYCY